MYAPEVKAISDEMRLRIEEYGVAEFFAKIPPIFDPDFKAPPVLTVLAIGRQTG